MNKLSKQYTRNSRNNMYVFYLTYRLNHNCSFEHYCKLHEINIKNHE